MSSRAISALPESSTNLLDIPILSDSQPMKWKQILRDVERETKHHTKNVPPLTCYDLYTHGSIATIFGINVAEKVGNQNVLYFPTSPN